MESVFIRILSASISAGFMVFAIVLIRVFFKKMPKNFRCILWMLVGIRLLFPFQVESVFGIVPRVEIERESALSGQSYAEMPQGDTPLGTSAENAKERDKKKSELSYGEKAGRTEGLIKGEARRLFRKAGAVCWMIGVLICLYYFCYSWYRVKSQLKTAILEEYIDEEENKRIRIYRSDRISTPFLFGIVHPQIYVPMQMEEEILPYIMKHECAHKRRKDYLIKPVAFLLLGIHWFNPCIWLAYKLMCRDIELACDELVIREFTQQEKKAYSTALLKCSIFQKKITACQAFFGESGLKERVKNVFGYKKPALLAVVLSVLVCIVVFMCFMTTRKGEAERIENETEVSLSQQEGAYMEENTETKGQENGSDAISFDQSSERLTKEGRTQAKEQETAERVRQWTEAFCNRDGEKIYDMYSEEYKKNADESEMMPTAENGYTFGWSSPWPWDVSEARMIELTEDHAEILYYAWVSDPHVSVWRQSLSYHMEGGKWLVDQVDTEIMEYICVLEEFEKAYPDGQINDTPMDYRKNGAGEALNNNALLSSTTMYRQLFRPDTAAVYLLNLLENEGKVEVTAEVEGNGDRAKVTIEFKEDGNRAQVLMVRPYGENGIWVPQTYGIFFEND